jgi:hypothetical protein
VARFFEPAHMPCADCGASIARAERAGHVCDAERKLDYVVFQLRGEVGAFDTQLAEWLRTAVGRFECWYAERDRRRGLAAG